MTLPGTMLMATTPRRLMMVFLTEHLQHERPYTLICGGLTLTHSAERWSKYEEEFAEFKQLASQASGKVIYLGLPFEFDLRRNWSLLELSEHEVQVSQHDKKGITRYRIDHASWLHENLGRELHPA